MIVADPAPKPLLVDSFGRRVSYLRVSVTDRCDFRCRYCMAEAMTFLPRRELLSLEELALIVDRFVDRGVTKVRLTGGEPLVRRGLPELAKRIGERIGTGLNELTLTTNGTRLTEAARPLAEAGVRRINVSLDTLDRERFAYIARRDCLDEVLAGIAAARTAGLAIKINMVALKGLNDDGFVEMAEWCAAQGFDLSIIETMPLGQIDEDRTDRFLPLNLARERLAQRFTLEDSDHSTGGPSRYIHARELDIHIGFISPLTHNFCASCNRVRLTAEGKLYLCLGQADCVDLKAALRGGGPRALDAALDEAMRIKPKAHDFRIERTAVSRHMSVTGG
ncbi:GTP 3',8-cyclase MoaA [Sphingomonas sp. MAH-20]|uniref:GTP 3',8-cyclase n=1 Tax=Sphingomonas horti TaxID=2682842 RepID=A0A6I4J2A6_9SPHN|nr:MULTISPECIES: GTP 3',8-cyclase MoaA [Sphingomonas]MBA2919576.1 GTP 3',8-cyclase MoaA [Sphingomonas sp. CGMCC 1.13658]MVO78456.1 GTP 3',8-cyclase MoaA [Sphingomonas horti]